MSDNNCKRDRVFEMDPPNFKQLARSKHKLTQRNSRGAKRGRGGNNNTTTTNRNNEKKKNETENKAGSTSESIPTQKPAETFAHRNPFSRRKVVSNNWRFEPTEEDSDDQRERAGDFNKLIEAASTNKQLLFLLFHIH